MTQEIGQMSIHSENIFPILKRWLYTDREIFIRELVSNGVDAITKYKRLVSLGEAPEDGEDYEVTVVVDRQKGALIFSDNGIGMTADEVRRYLNTVAFSSAAEFVEKYKSDEGNQIIGHFGLGFYSAFMAAKKVVVETQSWQDVPTVVWQCEGDTRYTLEEGEKRPRGTTITLYLDDESQEFLQVPRVKETLIKYCGFLPYPIYVYEVDEEGKTVGAEDEPCSCGHDHGEDEPCSCDHDHKDGEETAEEDHKKGDGGKEEPAVKLPEPVNDIHPLWMRPAAEITDQEYKDFYHKLFTDFEDPLFWVHLNADFPIRVKGVLYFPKISHQMQTLEGKIKLYNNQVFVADNVPEVIPDYLMMLRGTVDCPDLPLNVSRSALQKDREVQKIPAYIARKVADKLVGMFNSERENYEKYWKDIRVFVEYACLKDEKFYDRVKETILYPLAGGGFTTLEEYLEKGKALYENKVYYASHEEGQASVLTLFKEKEVQALVLDSPLDSAFISLIESKHENVHFARVDAELPDVLKGEGTVDLSDQTALETALRRVTGQEQLKVTLENLADADTVAVIQINEQSRRWQEMMQMNAMGDDNAYRAMLKGQQQMVFNAASPVVKALAKAEREGHPQDDQLLQIYDLARLAGGFMDPNEMAGFVRRSQQMMRRQLEQ
jgi:molecular chaperone HtpG